MASELSQEQLDHLREQLQARSEELRDQIREEMLRSEDPGYAAVADQVHDMEEEAVADLIIDMNLTNLNRHVQELAEIDKALARMDQGVYGLCVDTGEPISYERLKAQPTAMRTVDAQEAWERTHAQPGRPTL